MKKFLLALLLILSSVSLSTSCSYIYEPVHYSDPKEMISHLQRVMHTSTNPQEIVEAERLIREVYGPMCQQRFWNRVKYTSAGIISFLVFLRITDHEYGASLLGSGALLTWMAIHDNQSHGY